MVEAGGYYSPSVRPDEIEVTSAGRAWRPGAGRFPCLVPDFENRGGWIWYLGTREPPSRIGDRIQLNSGNPVVLVMDLDADLVTVVWPAGIPMRRNSFSTHLHPSSAINCNITKSCCTIPYKHST
jgi:hypothetical protein